MVDAEGQGRYRGTVAPRHHGRATDAGVPGPGLKGRGPGLKARVRSKGRPGAR
jgi:hypothetical protein